MKNLDKILLIISIAIFIVVLILKLIPTNPISREINSIEIKQSIEKSINEDLEKENKEIINENLNKNENNKGPYPPFVEFVE